MRRVISRRSFLGTIPLAAALSSLVADAQEHDSAETETVTYGDLKAVFRDNRNSPKILSGVDSLENLRDAPGFDAFDPDSRGASAGLNFEHIISGHPNPHSAFAPRQGPFSMTVTADQHSVELVRKREDDPWAMSSRMKYTLVEPHSIDVDFRCVPHDRSLFGERGYAVLFFANYMNDVENIGLHFRGVEGQGQPEKWIVADAPKAHPDWNQGGTYHSLNAADLMYDADHNFKLNTWSYDYPRFSKPFYFGRAAHGMTLILMFNKMLTAEEEIRFSLFKFKLAKFPRPAWDFQYVIHNIQAGKEYGFRARLNWKKFISLEDCLSTYERWSAANQ